MAKTKLTARAVEAAKSAPSGTRYELYDTALPAFGLRVSDTGRKTWFLMYRAGGKLKRLTIGHFPTLSLADAREQAQRALRDVERGEDPAERKEAERRASAGALEHKQRTGYLPGSFGDLAGLYYMYECPNLRRGAEVQRTVERELMPAWRDRPLTELRRKDLTTILDPITAAGQIQKAHKVRELAIRLINWAVDRGDLDVNMLASPSRGRKRSGILRRTKRSRVLSDQEIRATWDACDMQGGVFAALVKVLLLTGQRRDEVAGMRWAEVDLQNGVWTIPADRYKTGIEHVVPLSDPVRRIIEGVAGTCGTFVFSTRPGTRFRGYSKGRARLPAGDPESEPWTLHDLRRTLRTGLSGLRVPDEIAERVLGHVIGGVEGVYNRHAYLAEKRDALDRWGAHILALVEPAPSNVVRLEAR